MTTLYASRRRVKSARPFGLGILRSLPVVRVDYTAADAAWWAEVSNATPTAEDRHYDELAEESAMQAGIDVAAY